MSTPSSTTPEATTTTTRSTSSNANHAGFSSRRNHNGGGGHQRRGGGQGGGANWDAQEDAGRSQQDIRSESAGPSSFGGRGRHHGGGGGGGRSRPSQQPQAAAHGSPLPAGVRVSELGNILPGPKSAGCPGVAMPSVSVLEGSARSSPAPAPAKPALPPGPAAARARNLQLQQQQQQQQHHHHQQSHHQAQPQRSHHQSPPVAQQQQHHAPPPAAPAPVAAPAPAAAAPPSVSVVGALDPNSSWGDDIAPVVEVSVEGLTAQLKAARDENLKLKSSLLSTQTQSDKLRVQLQTTTASLEQKIVEYNSMEKSFNLVSNTRLMLEDERDRTKSALSKAERTIKELKDKLAAQPAAGAAGAPPSDQLLQRIQQLETDIEYYQADLALQKALVAEAQSEVAKRDARLHELESAMGGLSVRPQQQQPAAIRVAPNSSWLFAAAPSMPLQIITDALEFSHLEVMELHAARWTAPGKEDGLIETLQQLFTGLGLALPPSPDGSAKWWADVVTSLSRVLATTPKLLVLRRPALQSLSPQEKAALDAKTRVLVSALCDALNASGAPERSVALVVEGWDVAEVGTENPAGFSYEGRPKFYDVAFISAQ